MPEDDWTTLRELDRRAGRPKGTAFRAFKALMAELREGTDFRVLGDANDAARIAALRAAQRIYAASRSAVLLAPGAAARVRERMDRR